MVDDTNKITRIAPDIIYSFFVLSTYNMQGLFLEANQPSIAGPKIKYALRICWNMV